MRFIDLTGKKFGRLIVLKRAENKGTKTAWLCKCDCGNEKIVSGDKLKTGNTKSCGCLNKELTIRRSSTHKMTNTRLYRLWLGIKRRCYNKNQPEYKNYGAKGIKMCDEWKNDFISFYNWSYEHGFDEKLSRWECSIDRIDTLKGYSPQNCRWVDIYKQANNKTNNHLLTFQNSTLTLTQWSKKIKISQSTIRHRLKRGWSVEKTLTTPLLK